MDTPTTEAELAALIRKAYADKTPLRIRGGGTRADLGRPAPPAGVLSTAGLSGITLYDPGALTMIAQAGTPMAEIEAALDAENQMLAFEPIDYRGLLGSSGEPTIGGTVAANVSGPRRVLVGACRDFVLGVRFVTGEGDIVKNGGRVMKNVTGLDLSKLQCGAYGGLGVLTEVSMKVMPKPQAAMTLMFEGFTAEQGLALLRKALGTPFELAGAAFLPGSPSRTCLRIEGLKTQVDYRMKNLAALFAGSSRIVTGEEHEALWKEIRDVAPFHGTGKPVWRLSVKPSVAADIAEALETALGAEAFFDWGGGLIWLQTPDATAEIAQQIRAEIAPHGGHATLIRGSAQQRAALDVFQPEAPRLAKISQQLRDQFDPAGVLNPGLMAA